MVPGGEFPLGRATETCTRCLAGCPQDMTCDSDETPEHVAKISDFRLDKYEVTVGRFRKFVDAYDKQELVNLLVIGGGTHPRLPASRWESEWNNQLPRDREALERNLACHQLDATWTPTAGKNEQFPINCVSWYEAFAFCAWDRGRLPTEAEWEYAAAGGSDNRLYPWGSAPPTRFCANYSEGANSPLTAVGSTPQGNGRWAHSDLSGSLWEPVLDRYWDQYYAGTALGCSDCSNLSLLNGYGPSYRGGSWDHEDYTLRAANRFSFAPNGRNGSQGVRCVRDR
ncbi:formylglycine-generating enzyme family protein [Myxococcota bacterium]